MSYSGSGNDGGWRNDGGVRSHAFDPDTQPELFRSVLTRRVFAFLIDLVVLTVPVILGYIFIAVFGVITLGLGWMLFWLAWPATIVWAIVYYGASIGGPHSATMGMRAMDLEVRTWYGVWAIKGTPAAIKDRMYKEVVKAMNEPDLKRIWAEQGADAGGMPPVEFGKLVHSEIAKWAKVVKDAGAKIDN